MTLFESVHKKIRSKRPFIIFTWMTRILIAIGFLPSGLKKLLGNRFTLLSIDTPIGFFFEALYRTGFYWNFLGFMQLLAALLLVIPRTTFLGAMLFLPIILNIFVIVCAMDFRGTPYVAGLMLLANIYLILWDYQKLRLVATVIFER